MVSRVEGDSILAIFVLDGGSDDAEDLVYVLEDVAHIRYVAG